MVDYAKEMSCETCIFFDVADGASDTFGGCHRYPLVTSKTSKSWCGEHTREVADTGEPGNIDDLFGYTEEAIDGETPY